MSTTEAPSTPTRRARSPRTREWPDAKGRSIHVGEKVRSATGKLSGIVKYRFTKQHDSTRVPMVGVAPDSGRLGEVPANVAARHPRHVAVPASELVLVQPRARADKPDEG